MGEKKALRFFEAFSVILFFTQALRVIFSVLFGIIYDQVFAGTPGIWLAVSNLLVLAAFLSPLVLPRCASRWWLTGCAMIAGAARIGLTVNDSSVRFWSSLVVLAAGGLYLALLARKARPTLLPGVFSALAVDQLLRLWGDTYDLSLRPGWLPLQIIWGVLVLATALWLARRAVDESTPGLGGLAGLALGGLLFLEISLLSLPNALARWSGNSYAVIAPLGLGILLAWMGFWYRLPLSFLQSRVSRAGLAILLLVFVQTGYFATGWVSAIALLAAQVLVLAGLTILFSGQPAAQKLPGGWLAAGLCAFLVLNYLNAFAFTYPYALPVMRGMGWAVYGLAALLGSLVVVAKPVPQTSASIFSIPTGWKLAGGALVLIAAMIAVWPQPASAFPGKHTLRIATYNIHYGYDADWHFNLEEIARTIEANQVDVLMMQEVDTGRLISYAADDAYYLSRRLGMKAVYLPAVEHLTGIGLLYRSQADSADWRLLTSLQEQTGILRVSFKQGGQLVHAFGIWMGLEDEDTQTQIREALGFIGEQTPAAFGGDFNAEPDSPVAQAMKAAGFSDPFVTLGIIPPPLTDPAVDPNKRIDYVWLRGLVPLNAWVAKSLASDHRMVVLEIEQ